MSKNVEKAKSDLIYSTTEQAFFRSKRLLVGIITLLCAGVLFTLTGYEAMQKLTPYLPTTATIPLLLGFGVAIWLGLPSVLLVLVRSRVKDNVPNNGFRSIETMLKSYMLFLSLFALVTFIMLMLSGKITDVVINWLLTKDDTIQKLEELLPRINTILATNDFKTFDNIPSLLQNPDTITGIDLAIKAIFALLTLVNALSSSMLKHAILSCNAIHRVLENEDAPEEIPQKISLLLIISAVFDVLFAVIVGSLLGAVIPMFALLMLSVAKITIATSIKHYRDERLLEILKHKKKRG